MRPYRMALPNGTSGSLMQRLNSILEIQQIIGNFGDIKGVV